jgi:LytS/YehU family sensor histidine kinase
LFVQRENQYWLFEYSRNPWYYLRIPAYLSIYLMVLGFILLVQYLQRVSMRQKFEAEKKIAEMQLLLLRNQIDSHFTFNAINAISASVLRNKPEEANDNIIRLSRLMRSCVEQADHLSRSLSLELEFVKNYLDLLKSRMDKAFEYVIEIDDDVDLDIQVPKMILQIYVENAVRHGIRPLDKGGCLWIRVKQAAQYLNIEIEDNGIGRRKARENGSSGTGKGMQIMEQFFVTFNKYNHQKISIEIRDLINENQQACGTKIVLKIPAGMKYSFYEK